MLTIAKSGWVEIKVSFFAMDWPSNGGKTTAPNTVRIAVVSLFTLCSLTRTGKIGAVHTVDSSNGLRIPVRNCRTATIQGNDGRFAVGQARKTFKTKLADMRLSGRKFLPGVNHKDVTKALTLIPKALKIQATDGRAILLSPAIEFLCWFSRVL
ncbi:MAG: hypothetical protein AAFN77_21325 [Planctomycetota bacterium]